MSAVNILALLNTFGQLPQQMLIFLIIVQGVKNVCCTVLASSISNNFSVDDILHVTYLHKDARGQNTKINYGMDTTGEKEKRKTKKKKDGRSTSNHDKKKFSTRSVQKQGGMAFGFRKTETAVIKPDR
jgi:hypothetical protein